MRNITVVTNSPEETFDIGYRIGKFLSGGDIVTLDGDLGAGKTLLTQGIGKALSIREDITSPTFSILNIYTSGRLPLYHFDAYRISSYDELFDIGYEEYNSGSGVIVIEWAKNIEDLPVENLIRITIERLNDFSLNTRRISINAYEGKELIADIID